MKYGYARVSPGGKSESVDAQVRQLTKAGCRKVFRDVHVSGAKTDRAQLRRLLDEIDDGDVLMVTRLDRLARSTRDLLNVLATITGSTGEGGAFYIMQSVFSAPSRPFLPEPLRRDRRRWSAGLPAVPVSPRCPVN
jgi:hypothetical protein